MYVATVVREHSHIDNAVVESDEAARAWLVEALYMVEEGGLAPDAPTPTMDELEEYAGEMGWDISVRRSS